MAVLHKLDVERIIRRAGARRVSEEAGEKLVEILEEKAEEIIVKAKLIAIHARGKKCRRHGKKPYVTGADIQLAVS